ncbi:unnamed protein product [Fraxinus pennsylvanica]|uniref:Uncharacterized protein n=1 Tax=Fraxinus pennsylvanica TaxID=56036 RepID=A0AAD2AAV4_9LAMI|nr:unnamed protein product [Fraxinus pennsylvanica]
MRRGPLSHHVGGMRDVSVPEDLFWASHFVEHENSDYRHDLGLCITGEGLQWARVINGYARFLDEAPELVKIIQVSCREDHSAACWRKARGLVCLGGGHPGQLGLEPQTGFFSCTPNESEVMLHNIPVLVILTAGQISLPIVFKGPNGVAAGVRARHSRCHAAWINGLKAAIRDPDQNELL